MTIPSKFIKRIKDYKKSMKILDCANYIYLDKINNFEFYKISKYRKSKNLYDKIICDFKLANELIIRQDLLNAATILRALYENIIYIIASSFDKTLKITIDIRPNQLRKILEENCKTLFTDYFEQEDFNYIYSYLCKLVHPGSIKELLSYMGKTVKYKNYLLGNLKYIMITIEYMYLNFLNKKIWNEENQFNLNIIDLCSYINFINISYFIDDVKDNKSYIKRYFYYDTNNKYINDNQKKLKDSCEKIINEKDWYTKYIKLITEELNEQIKNSKYNEVVYKILNDK